MAERPISGIALEAIIWTLLGTVRQEGSEVQLILLVYSLVQKTSSGGNKQASGHLFASLHSRRLFWGWVPSCVSLHKTHREVCWGRVEASDTYIASAFQERNRKLDLSTQEDFSFSPRVSQSVLRSRESETELKQKVSGQYSAQRGTSHVFAPMGPSSEMVLHIPRLGTLNIEKESLHHCSEVHIHPFIVPKSFQWM